MKAEPGKPLTKDQVEQLISNELTTGQQYVYGPDNVASDRDRNFDYRRGVMNDLPAPNGRSKVTDRTVGSYIDLMKPNLMRIFTAGRNIGEYVSPKPELTEPVKLITRYVNDVVLKKDNRGELMLQDWAEDALVQKLGTVMGWWEERYESKDEIHDGIPDQALPLVAQQIQQSGAQLIEHSAHQVVAQTPTGPMPSQIHSIKVRTKTNKSKLCLDVIPPEEYIISRDARNDDDAIMEAHRTGVEAGYLIGEGFDPALVNELPTYSQPYPDRMSKYNSDGYGLRQRDNSVDPMLRKIGVVRGKIKCDYDGTGIKDWFFVAGGEVAQVKLLQDLEPYNFQVFFANFCPQPAPHTVYGRCPADDLCEVQKTRTVLTRQMLDCGYLHNTPQREVVMDWIVKPDQLMNMAPGAPVLVKQPNAIREIQVPYVGAEMLQTLQYFEGEAELRSGVGRNTAGLDPEVLSNQSATANNNMVSAQQGRVEMIARIWGFGGMRKLFRGILKCLIAYQDFARVVQIDGDQQTVDPRTWQGLEELEVNINTGLGTGNRDKDLIALQGIDVAQKEIISVFGIDNPIVDLKKAVRTKQLMAEAAGIQNPEAFFGDPKNPDGSDWKPQPPPPPQPSPDTMVMAKTEDNKTQQKAQSDNANIQLQREEVIAKIASNERVQNRIADQNYDLGLRKLGIDHGNLIVAAAKVDAENIRSDMEAGRAA